MSGDGERCRACGRKLPADSCPARVFEPVCEVCVAQLEYLLDLAAFLRDVEPACREALQEDSHG